MSETLSVTQLCHKIENLVNSGFPEEVWVEGVLSSLKRSQNGHVYFDLLDTDQQLGKQANSVLAVTLFSSARQRVNRILKKAGSTKMEDGAKVRIRGAINFYAPQGRVQMIMSLVDPDYTIAQLTLDKDKLLADLKAKNLLRKNAKLPIPALCMKVAVVTSIGSAAYEDFTNEIYSSGFNFSLEKLDCRVQGIDAVPTIVNAIKSANQLDVDAIVLIRGGGARGDLAAFDHSDIAMAIVNSSKPVITGIGHDIDHSVSDDVAHTQTKTPTAAAAFLIRKASQQAEAISMHRQKLLQLATRSIENATTSLNAMQTGISRESIRYISKAELSLANTSSSLLKSANRQVQTSRQQLQAAQQKLTTEPSKLLDADSNKLKMLTTRINALDPKTTLQRGWTITRTQSGGLVRNPADLQSGDTLITTTQKGDIESVVTFDDQTHD